MFRPFTSLTTKYHQFFETARFTPAERSAPVREDRPGAADRNGTGPAYPAGRLSMSPLSIRAVLPAFVLLFAIGVARGQDFGVYSRISSVGNKSGGANAERQSQATSLFHAGKV